MFFDLTRCLNPAVLSLGCPTPQVCVKECPKQIMTLSKATMRPYCSQMDDATFSSKSKSELINEKLCPPWVLASTPFLGRCLPTFLDTSNDNTTLISSNDNDGVEVKKGTVKHAMTALGAFLSVRNFGERIFNDLSDTWWMIGIGFCLAFVLSFTWILLMRWLTSFMVWLSLGLIFVIVAGLFGYSLHRYLQVKDVASSQISILQVNLTPEYLNDVLELADTWLAFTCICGIFTSVILLVLIALRQRILIAIQLLEQSAKAVGQMCSTVFWPLFPFIFHIVVVFWFAFVAIHLSSAGTKVYTINYDLKSFGNLQSRSLSLGDLEPPSSCYSNNNCRNPLSGQRYSQNDTCNPSVFNTTCLNCPQVPF